MPLAKLSSAWSHAAGETQPKVVLCGWRATGGAGHQKYASGDEPEQLRRTSSQCAGEAVASHAQA
jgi:hypothetical protein